MIAGGCEWFKIMLIKTRSSSPSCLSHTRGQVDSQFFSLLLISTATNVLTWWLLFLGIQEPQAQNNHQKGAQGLRLSQWPGGYRSFVGNKMTNSRKTVENTGVLPHLINQEQDQISIVNKEALLRKDEMLWNFKRHANFFLQTSYSSEENWQTMKI